MSLVSCGGDSSVEEVKYDSLQDADSSLRLHDIYQQNGTSTRYLNSIGEQNILVLPIHIEMAKIATDDLLLNLKGNINKTFFGSSSDTYWESVSSFYYKSSYGKCTLKGTVADIYDSNMSYKDLVSTSSSSVDKVLSLINKAVNNYKTVSGSNCTEFDTDKDGLIDAVWVIYDIPNLSNYSYSDINENNNPYWAYTIREYVTTPNVLNPTLGAFSWASYDFMGKSSKLDSHTYVHETGHLFGLDDYYDYNSKFSPMGGIDMMDYNVGDHTSYSKFLLGWITPKIVDMESISLELNSATDTGECLLLKPDDYNGTAYCEYFLVQYITPTGLNYDDYINGYYTIKSSGKNLTVYSKPGFMITHVDSYFGYQSGLLSSSFIKSTKPSEMKEQLRSNTTSDKKTLIMMMQKDYSWQNSNVILNESFLPTDNALFYDDDSFNLKTNSKYCGLMASSSSKTNDGKRFRYQVTVDSCSALKGKVTIHYLG